jgi:hypothetical protein
MGKHVVTQLNTFKKFVCWHTDEHVCLQVMQGSEKINPATSLERVARWTHGALAQLDNLVDKQTIRQIMAERGRACAQAGLKSIQKAHARRIQYQTLEMFLEAEIQLPARGSTLIWEANTLVQTYTPQAFGLRCYCPLLRKLPAELTAPESYCECSRAFVEWSWRSILDIPVKVELRESCVTGGSECRFVIHLDNLEETP